MTVCRVLVATRNVGKLRELTPMLAAAGWAPLDLTTAGIPESPAEDDLECHATFEENALAKAWYFAGLAEGLPVLADDSGLVVDALHGAPGVHSRRWAALAGEPIDPGGEGAANNARLLRLLDAADADAGRSARFVCAAAWVDCVGGQVLVRRGEVEGEILRERRGAGGFGYDPYFFSRELGCGFAEATGQAKAVVSHRGRAVRSLLRAVDEGGGAGRVAGDGVDGLGIDG